MEIIILVILAALFALSMGGSNFGVSFAAAHGGRVITRRRAQVLFIIFVFLGAVTFGRPVAETLGTRIIPRELLSIETMIIMLIAVTVSLFISNLLHVPQSTSLVTVGALVGIGMYFGKVYYETFYYLVPFWVLLPVAGYFITYFVGKLVYPPRQKNFWIYEKLVNNTRRLRAFVVAASCYNAFSVGTNNVANAVGPLAGADLISKTAGLALTAPVFGAGGLVFHGALKTVGERIVPLGLLTATIICLVTATLMIIASLLGVPQSFVMLKLACVSAIGGLKNGHKNTFLSPIMRRTYISWVITPACSLVISLLLTWGWYDLLK